MEESFESLESIKQLFAECFTNDFGIWIKWIIMFVSIIVTFIISFKILHILDPNKRLKEKCEKARKAGHVIQGKLIKQWFSESNGEYMHHGVYEYTINNKTRKYSAMFSGYGPSSNNVPSILHLYYEKSPRRLFSEREYHYSLFGGMFLVMIKLSPLIIGGLVGWSLGLRGI